MIPWHLVATRRSLGPLSHTQLKPTRSNQQPSHIPKDRALGMTTSMEGSPGTSQGKKMRHDETSQVQLKPLT